jgi:hypothetical protein
MSYKTIKNYFSRRLASFNLQEAKKKFSFENDSENFDNQYIFENPKTELEDGDTVNSKFFPKRAIIIKTANKTSENSVIFDYDAIQTRLENVLRDIHSAANYRSDGVRRISFESLEVSISGTYILGQMSFKVEDELAYVT